MTPFRTITALVALSLATASAADPLVKLLLPDGRVVRRDTGDVCRDTDLCVALTGSLLPPRKPVERSMTRRDALDLCEINPICSFLHKVALEAQAADARRSLVRRETTELQAACEANWACWAAYKGIAGLEGEAEASMFKRE